jgi:raffinose/stachyose/melibiose transport system permease protein
MSTAQDMAGMGAGEAVQPSRMRALRRANLAPLLVLIVLAATALFPLFLVLVNSFKEHAAIVRNPLALPQVFDFANYSEAWRYGKFTRGFFNSIVLSGTTILVVLICSSLAGYVLAGKKVRVWPAVMIYFLVAMTVPIQLFLFPLYFAFARMQLLGNVVAVGFVLAAINLPISVLLMRTFFLGVPAELEEAARIDGAGVWQVLWHIMLPVVSPGLITVAVIVGLASWNEFLITSTFLQGERNFTATLGFLSMNGTYNVDQGLMMAAAVIMIAPVIVFFVLVQRYFIDGLVSGAVKG